MNGDSESILETLTLLTKFKKSGVTNQSCSAHYVQKTNGVTSHALLTTFEIQV